MDVTEVLDNLLEESEKIIEYGKELREQCLKQIAILEDQKPSNTDAITVTMMDKYLCSQYWAKIPLFNNDDLLAYISPQIGDDDNAYNINIKLPKDAKTKNNAFRNKYINKAIETLANTMGVNVKTIRTEILEANKE